MTLAERLQSCVQMAVVQRHVVLPLAAVRQTDVHIDCFQRNEARLFWEAETQFVETIALYASFVPQDWVVLAYYYMLRKGLFHQCQEGLKWALEKHSEFVQH